MKTDKKTKQVSCGSLLCIAAVCLTAVVVLWCLFSYFQLHRQAALKDQISLSEDGSYYSTEDVSAYLYKYGHLPDNYITKSLAQASGWTGGSLEAIMPGYAIGGDRFHDSYRSDLPLAKATGRYYRECDVNTQGKPDRGLERLIYSNDGLVYYTPDHYQSVILLYGTP